MIQDDEGTRPQLVHVQRIRGPSAISQLFRHSFGSLFKPSPTKALDMHRRDYRAVADAHEFVSRNYRTGDQVILVAHQAYYGDRVIKAMEIFAGHLYDGTTPGEPTRAQPEAAKSAPGMRIPIHAVVAIWLASSMESKSSLSDQLKSRFPAAIERVICCKESDSDFWSCSTVFDLDGGIVSREVELSHRDRRFGLLTTGHR
ncbi:unnamed protein product [Rhizoctonia solani]|uniref:Uncharacterized protein n=1 Tax=Rhizoctonia solani TaxID=456999 RepID=A0A8H3D0A0_9AGAM|nr:unnamed protein product [Rhizoctonia solani]